MIRIRFADMSDEAFVLDLADRFGPTRAAWREHEEVVCGTRRHLTNALRSPCADDAVLIAIGADGVALGFAYVVTQTDFFTGEPHGHLSELAAVADGSGAGSGLLEACERWSRERGHRYLSLNVNDTNENARRFYERRAYVPEYRHLVKILDDRA